MVIVIFPSATQIRYDLGGLLFGSHQSIEDVFEFLLALKENENTFMIQVPVYDPKKGEYDTEGIVIAGRVYQFLDSLGLYCRLMYEESPFPTP